MLASDQELLRHILEEATFIRHYTNGKTKQEVVNDPLLCRALIRSLEIIGEATKRLDATFKTEHARIQWKKIAGTRDRLVHDYLGVDYDIVWDIIRNKIPELQQYILKLLKKEG